MSTEQQENSPSVEEELMPNNRRSNQQKCRTLNDVNHQHATRKGAGRSLAGEGGGARERKRERERERERDAYLAGWSRAAAGARF